MLGGWRSSSQEGCCLCKGVSQLYTKDVQRSSKRKIIRVSHPSNLGSKTFDVILLSLQHILGDEQRE